MVTSDLSYTENATASLFCLKLSNAYDSLQDSESCFLIPRSHKKSDGSLSLGLQNILLLKLLITLCFLENTSLYYCFFDFHTCITHCLECLLHSSPPDASVIAPLSRFQLLSSLRLTFPIRALSQCIMYNYLSTY